MGKNIAHPDPTATLDTVAKFFRIMDKAGAPLAVFTPPMQSIAKRKNLAEYLNLGCPKVDGNGVVNATPSDHDLARLILGDDFITPEDVAAARGLAYTDEQLEALESSLPPIEKIAWCRGNGFMILPAPPRALSLLEIRSLEPELFYTKEGSWYAEDNQAFSRNDRTEVATWLIVRKGVVPGSPEKSWKEQLPLISGSERVPNAAEFAWALTTYKEVRGVYLMSNVYARTSSVASGGHRVVVSYFGSLGLLVRVSWDGDRLGYLGVASARKFN